MRINLLEKEHYFRVEQAIFLVVAALILLFWHQVLSREGDRLKGRVYGLQQTLEVLKDKKRVESQGVNQGQKDLARDRGRLASIFASIHQSTKRSLTLTQLLVDHQNVEVKGETAVIADLTSLVSGLTSLQGKKVTINKVGRRGDLYEFLISW